MPFLAEEPNKPSSLKLRSYQSCLQPDLAHEVVRLRARTGCSSSTKLRLGSSIPSSALYLLTMSVMNASLTVLVTLIMLMLPIGVILLLERVMGCCCYC